MPSLCPAESGLIFTEPQPRPVSPRPPHPFCRGVGDLNKITFQKGRDQPGPGLGCDVTSRASHLALQRWWPWGWLEGQATVGGSLSCALLGRSWKEHCALQARVCQHHLASHSCSLCSPWISTLGQLSPTSWKESQTPLFLQKPLYFLLAVGSWRDWSLMHLDVEQKWMVK